MKKLLTLAIVLSVLVFTLILPAGFTLGQSAYADTKQAAPAEPSIDATPTDNWINIGDFTPNASVTLEIYDAEGGGLVYGPETLFTDDTGDARWHSWRGMGEEFFDLRAGHYIVVTDNETGTTKTLIPIQHTFDRLDIADDVASGTAPPFSTVHVYLRLDRTGEHHFLEVTANANGDWTADFGAAGMDVLPFMHGTAKIFDDDGDATCDNPPTMHFWWHGQEEVKTKSFTPDASVTIEFYDAPGGNRLYGPETHFTNADGRIEPMLELYAHDVIPVPGNCLVITDDVSTYSKMLVIPDDTLDPVDYVNNLVTGTALPFAPLMAVVDTSSGQHDQFDLFADENGNWTADFGARGVDLGWDTTAGAWTQDEDHDCTWIPGLPWIMASLTGDWMGYGNITPHGTVTFEIYDSVGGNRVFGPQTYSPEEGEWIITPGINLVPGNYIVATDDLSGRVKDLVLVEASVTLFDREQDLLAGTAPPFATVEVDTTQLPFQIHHRMRVSADADGHWVADFGAHGFDITEEEWTAQAKVLDEDYDSTAAQPVPQPELWAVRYRWGEPAPGYSFDDWPIFKGWMNVRIENRGGFGGDAFNVTAEVMSWPANTTVPDPNVTVGNIPAQGASAWSTDTFETWVDMSNPVGMCEEVFWRIEYDDAAGVHHVIENVPEFPPGEGPPPCP